jgi:hypothetical protein
MAVETSAQTVTPPFLRLPLEARLVIYNLVFFGSIISSLPASQRTPSALWDHSQSQHYLLLTCRQIYINAQQLFYSANTWHVGHEDAWVFFRRRTIYQQAEWIKHVRLDGFNDLASFEEQNLPLLETLTVIVDATSELFPCLPRELFKELDGQQLLDSCISIMEAHFLGTQEFEKYLELAGLTFFIMLKARVVDRPFCVVSKLLELSL